MAKENETKAPASRKQAREAIGGAAATRTKVEKERDQFRSLILSNPNYFGNLEASPYKPVKLIQGNKSYEELVCVGLNPPFDRLEGVIHIKRPTGYSGTICTPGTFEYVRFYVDLFDNGVWHDVGLTSVRVHDIPGDKPLCYAVKLDFSPIRKLCFFENIISVRAILSWNVPPPANTPNFVPVWGNTMTVQAQVRPRRLIIFDDILSAFKQAKIKIPDPIGPVIKAVDPQATVQTIAAEPLTLAQKKVLYANKGVPVHRFGFPEAQKLVMTPSASPAIFAANAKGPLVDLGLTAAEVAELIGKIQIVTDGDTSYEELKCVGLYPAEDMLEAVLTVKKSSGYSGTLCTNGSTEYVAFWIDFMDGGGFTYMGTATVQVHDLQTLPEEGVQFAVFLKTNLAKRLVPCEIGPRVVRLRGILSWETPPPSANPNHVPVWGNREDCLVQLRPGVLTGHIPVIETVGNMGVDDMNQTTGLATGNGQIASFFANQSPFGGEVRITGRLGDPPNSFGGGVPSFKYRIEVSPDGVDDWHPLTNKVSVKKTEFLNGIPQQCAPGEFVCDVDLLASDDGDGLGDGWYDYLEDLTLPNQRFLVVDKLASWQTNAGMEGVWKIRITAKDPSTSPPTVYPGIQVVKVRIDNTPPSGPPAPGVALAITGATFNGNPIPAVACGKFPVGSIITGTYEVHDPGTTSPNQHFGALTLSVIPAGPANGATVDPSVRSFPVPVPTTGEAGTWTLDTAGMDPCGYVIRLLAHDRTIVNSGSIGFYMTADVGFCLEAAAD